MSDSRFKTNRTYFNTVKEEGYNYIKYEKGVHHLQMPDSNVIEMWAANKDHAGAKLIYKNTYLEFLGSYPEHEQ